MKYTSPARRAAAAAVLIGALGATGCSAINYQATTHVYSGSDGTMFDTEDVALRHMVLVAGEENGPARLIGLASHTNPAAQGPVEVSIEIAGDTLDLSLEPGEAVNLEHDEELVVSAIDSRPGSLQEVTVTVDGTEESFNATVVDGTLEEYRDLLPDDFDASVLDHLEHGPDTWGSGAAHHDPDDDGH
ncbi:hypothetical protein [Nesterenkonia haasae]|uniref:hypothetical protein n=1 Tax=Nesterenkonia haasae TaxID=2587813 RepID=UPI001391EFBF|nr:hypothetical protein [Nesterenkonia haasae]NDK33250.1 hypothetical protein [Nesterenkonia haasae]